MPYFGQLVNFTSTLRKHLLVAFGLFNADDNLGFIASADIIVPLTLSPPPDGENFVFTIPFGEGVPIWRNGVLQLLGTHYTIAGNTLIFIQPYIPQPGDYFQTAP